MWLFAYGSLMWRPGFTYERAEPARLDGWARRFWQGSTDHRGTQSAPGRVVTLLPDPQGQCIGIAYEIDPQGAASTLRALDVREQGGYRREQLPVVLCSGVKVSVLTYLAQPSNANFLGPADLAVMAAQIAEARGLSGTNLEYLLLLERALVLLEAT